MIIFITGNPGCGKSTLIQELIKSCKSRKIAGVITPEVRKDHRQGFLIRDIASGTEKVMASTDIRGPKVSKYGVDTAAIDEIVAQTRKSIPPADIIFIDELGTMELYSNAFKQLMEDLMTSKKTIVIALHRGLVGRYKDRGNLFVLTRENYDAVKKEVQALL